MDIFCLDFIFHDTRLNKTQNTSKTFFGNIASFSNQFNLFWFFDTAKRFHNGKIIFNSVFGVIRFYTFYKTIFTRFHFHSLAIVVVIIKVNDFGLFHEYIKNGIKVTQPINSLNTRNLSCLFFTKLGPFPNGNVFIGFLQK